jgi:hypothetical protein
MALARLAIARMADAERATDRVIGRLLGNAARILPKTLRAVATAVWRLAFNVAVIERGCLPALRFMVAARRGIYIKGSDHLRSARKRYSTVVCSRSFWEAKRL